MKERPPFPKGALSLLPLVPDFYAGGVGGVGDFFSRCGARSTWLALCHARSFSGWRVYWFYMMAPSSTISS
ncbi:MAG: hypothetical protein HY674_04640 [Chloroflexi bacterium]|nr:hypothetical protein [Chloroflexota bacterium]